MPLSHLNGWRALDAVLRTGAIGRAAEVLGVTPAATAAQIRGLEDRLGRELFRRTSGGLVPRDATRAEAPALRAAFEALEGVQRRLGVTEEAGTVSLAVSQTFAETWLPHHMPDLFARAGRIEAGLPLWKRLAYVAITRAEERLFWVTRYRLGRPATPLGTDDLTVPPAPDLIRELDPLLSLEGSENG